MESFDQKYFNKLKEANMFDGTNLLLVTKWNASLGASYITTFLSDLFITPYGYGDCVSKTKKINKSSIKDMNTKKSFWTGNKFLITLNDGTTIKYSIPDSSWIDNANDLINWWKQK